MVNLRKDVANLTDNMRLTKSEREQYNEQYDMLTRVFRLSVKYLQQNDIVCSNANVGKEVFKKLMKMYSTKEVFEITTNKFTFKILEYVGYPESASDAISARWSRDRADIRQERQSRFNILIDLIKEKIDYKSDVIYNRHSLVNIANTLNSEVANQYVKDSDEGEIFMKLLERL